MHVACYQFVDYIWCFFIFCCYSETNMNTTQISQISQICQISDNLEIDNLIKNKENVGKHGNNMDINSFAPVNPKPNENNTKKINIESLAVNISEINSDIINTNNPIANNDLLSEIDEVTIEQEQEQERIVNDEDMNEDEINKVDFPLNNKNDEIETAKENIAKMEQEDKQLQQEQEELIKLLSLDNNKILKAFTQFEQVMQNENENAFNDNIAKNENDLYMD